MISRVSGIHCASIAYTPVAGQLLLVVAEVAEVGETRWPLG